MDVIRIEGGIPLNGTVSISGAKNACLPIFAATLLTGEPCTIRNVPNLSDVRFMAEILAQLGATVEDQGGGVWRIEASEIKSRASYDLVRRMRASVCLLGPLVGRLRRAEMSLPGGCVIGPRPIDLHIKGLIKLGCEVRTEAGYVKVDGSGLKGGELFLGGRHGSTVTGTANMLMAAVLAPGVTCIDSAACEPEIVDLCRMLEAMGARIEGIGSHRLIITGVASLRGVDYRVLEDRIEAGTYMLAAGITRGDVTVEGAALGDMAALLNKLEEAGLPCELLGSRSVRVRGDLADLRPVDIITLPHPGFPTDLQAQMSALMSITEGISIVTERIYPNRFMHVSELQRMGADISIEGANAIIKGVKSLSGAPVMASDLRASAALIMAGLAASGETWVQRIYHLDRGYENLDEKFRGLGARIERLSADAMPGDFAQSDD